MQYVQAKNVLKKLFSDVMKQVDNELSSRQFDLMLPRYDAKRKENNIPQSIISQELERKLVDIKTRKFKTSDNNNKNNNDGVHLNSNQIDDAEMEIEICEIIIQTFRQLYYKYIGHDHAVFMVNISSSNRQCLVDLFDTQFCKQHYNYNYNNSNISIVKEDFQQRELSKINYELQNLAEKKKSSKIVVHGAKNQLCVWLVKLIIDNFEGSVFEVSTLMSGAYLRLTSK